MAMRSIELAGFRDYYDKFNEVNIDSLNGAVRCIRVPINTSSPLRHVFHEIDEELDEIT